MFGFSTMVTVFIIGTHSYVFWRLRAAFGGGWWQVPVLLLFAGLAALLLLTRPPVRMAMPDVLYQCAHLWLGIMMITTVTFAGVDALRLVLYVTDRATGAAWLLPGARTAGMLALVLSVGLSAYAYWRAMTPVPAHLTLTSPTLRAGSPPLRVVAISDMHLATVIGPERLERMTRVIAAQKPDVVALVGDIVDSDMRGKRQEEELLRGVVPAEGGFAVLGNHEAYRGVTQAEDFLTRSGYRVLRGTSVTVRDIVIAGVDDPALGSSIQNEKALLQSLPQDRFILFLRHRPTNSPELAGLYDLQVAGHTHGGQIWPGRIFVRQVNGVSQGLSTISGDEGSSLLYVLNGAGFWGPPMRLGAQPDLLVLDIVPQP